MNKKDQSLALEIAEAFFQDRPPVIDGKTFASVHSNPTLNLADKIGAALTAVRKEARDAAFKDAKDALQSPTPGTMASTHFHQGFEQMRHLGIVAIERAAANTQEGGGDG